MDELIKASKNFIQRRPDDNFYIEVKNKNIISLCREPKENTVKISQQDYKFLLDKGIDYYVYDGGIIKKPKKVTSSVFPVLKKDVKGYELIENDPFWPGRIVEGGLTWQTPSE